MKLSLRAYALKQFLSVPRTLEDIKSYTTDSPSIINEVIRELEKKKFLDTYEESGTFYFLCSEPQSDKITGQEKRIEQMFYKLRPYYIIAWWLAEEGRFYDNDEELKVAVERQYEHACKVQFFSDEYLYKGYEEYKREVPNLRSLEGLFKYATIARGY